MESLKVTKEIAIRAILCGSCKIPSVGSETKEYSSSDLQWGERLFTRDELKKLKIPLWAMSGSGSGSGYGDGSGDGSGYGYGYGDGDGSGYGDGDG